jgi:hypothetical protein
MTDDISSYLLDHYGFCDRGSDCHWGKDALGRYDGCLKTGWHGRRCKHWHPAGATTLKELMNIKKVFGE